MGGWVRNLEKNHFHELYSTCNYFKAALDSTLPPKVLKTIKTILKTLNTLKTLNILKTLNTGLNFRVFQTCIHGFRLFQILNDIEIDSDRLTL